MRRQQNHSKSKSTSKIKGKRKSELRASKSRACSDMALSRLACLALTLLVALFASSSLSSQQQQQQQQLQLQQQHNSEHRRQQTQLQAGNSTASATATTNLTVRKSDNVITIRYANVSSEQGSPQLQQALQVFKLYNEPLSVDVIISRFSTSIQLFDVSNNALSTLSKDMFCPLSNDVKSLNISRNLLENFDCLGLISTAGQLCLSELRVLDMSFNLIRHLPATGVATLQKLEVLNLSNNQIESLDELSLSSLFKLTQLDLSHNKLTFISPRTFHKSASIVSLRLAHNAISMQISANLLFGLTALETLDLSYNNISSVADNAFADKPKLKVDLSFNSLTTLRRYKSHCVALCQCCEFETCDCEMMCPDNCQCYYDHSWKTNIVHCSASNQTSVPTRIPMDVTNLYLDANNIHSLKPHVFIGRKAMRSLYLNATNLHSLANKTFNGLIDLQVLHLNDNKLRALNGYEFESLAQLKHLYLQSNRLEVIHNATFINLRSLEVLNLAQNKLTSITSLQLFRSIGHHNVRLRQLFIAHNLWSCQCNLINAFRQILSINLNYISVVDKNQLRCYVNATTLGPAILDSTIAGLDINYQLYSAIVDGQQERSLNELNMCSDDASTAGPQLIPSQLNFNPSPSLNVIEANMMAPPPMPNPFSRDFQVYPPNNAPLQTHDAGSQVNPTPPQPPLNFNPLLNAPPPGFHSALDDAFGQQQPPPLHAGNGPVGASAASVIIVLLVVALMLVAVLSLLLFVRRYQSTAHKRLTFSGYRSSSRDESSLQASSDKIYDAYISYDEQDRNFVMQHLSSELEYGQPQYR